MNDLAWEISSDCVRSLPTAVVRSFSKQRWSFAARSLSIRCFSFPSTMECRLALNNRAHTDVTDNELREILHQQSKHFKFRRLPSKRGRTIVYLFFRERKRPIVFEERRNQSNTLPWFGTAQWILFVLNPCFARSLHNQWSIWFDTPSETESRGLPTWYRNLDEYGRDVEHDLFHPGTFQDFLVTSLGAIDGATISYSRWSVTLF